MCVLMLRNFQNYFNKIKVKIFRIKVRVHTKNHFLDIVKILFFFKFLMGYLILKGVTTIEYIINIFYCYIIYYINKIHSMYLMSNIQIILCFFIKRIYFSFHVLTYVINIISSRILKIDIKCYEKLNC